MPKGKELTNVEKGLELYDEFLSLRKIAESLNRSKTFGYTFIKEPQAYESRNIPEGLLN